MQKVSSTKGARKRTPQERAGDDAAALRVSVARAAAFILARRGELDRQGKADVPLAVLAGEDHGAPAYYVHHMLLLKELSAREPETTVCQEMPHDIFRNVLRGFSGGGENPLVTERMQRERGRDDAFILRALMAYCSAHVADHSSFIFKSFLLKRGFPLVLADASMTSAGSLNALDWSTAESLSACFDYAVTDLDMYSSAGVFVRNEHMARKAVERARENGARILFIPCGSDHAAGSRCDGFPARQSLSAIFKREGIPVIAMPVVERGVDDLPADHGLGADELCRVGLPGSLVRAGYDPETGTSLDNFPRDIRCREDEAAYVNALLEQTGLGAECLTVAEYRALKSSCRDDVVPQFDSWTEQVQGGAAKGRRGDVAGPS